MKIPLSAPDVGDLEIAYVTEVLRSGLLSLGPKLTEFEKRFAEFVGTRYAVAANSGTSALHMCVRALGIGTGDEAITTSFSFVASTNCLFYEGASPCFVDIAPRTLNVDAQAIRHFLRDKCEHSAKGVVNKTTGRRIKAILPVHVFGLPCDMRAIIEIAEEYDLFVIEDACEAIGAECHGRRVGSLGDAAVFAFYPNKQMTTGEGGMVVTNDASLAEICRSMRNQGRDADASWLKHVRLGYNYRLNDIQAALGIAQLERLDEILTARAEVARKYSERLSDHEDLILPPEEGCSKRSWFVYVIQFQGSAPGILRDRVRARLLSKGIASQAYFPAIHRQPYFQELFQGDMPHLPNTDLAASSCLALPFWSRLSTAEVHFVCDEVLRALDEVAENQSHEVWSSASRAAEARL